MIYYAVYRGYKTGIFMFWDDAKKAVDGYSGAVYKKFNNIDDAEHFVKTGEIRNFLEKPAKKVHQTQTSKPIQNQIQTSKPNLKPIQNQTKESYMSQAKKLMKDYYNHSDYNKINTVHNIYSDGSAFSNGQSGAVGGYGVFIPGTQYVEEYVATKLIKGKTTNNIGELYGLIHSLEHILLIEMDLPEDQEISWVINYDSEYAVGVITGKMRSSKNIDIVKTGNELLNMCKQQHINLTFNHIYSHTGSKDLHSIGNDVADRLAKARGIIQ